MHSGPSLEYRIIGTLAVGTDVNALEYNEETKFMQVKTNAGKVGWVKLSELQQQPPANILLPKIQKELAASKNTLKRAKGDHGQTLTAKDQEIAEKDKLIAKLRFEKKALEESVAKLEALNVEFDILKETKESRMMTEWLMYGGSILFFGILFGLILPFLPRRKKSNSGW